MGTDDRDLRKKRPAAPGAVVLADPIDEDPTPVDGGWRALHAQLAEHAKADEALHKEHTTKLEGFGMKIEGLGLHVASLTGNVGALVDELKHRRELERISALGATKLTAVRTQAELDDKNDKKATARKIALAIFKTVGAIVTLIAGGFIGAGLHGC